MFKHILIPTDGSILSEKAIVSGVEMAKLLGARVTGMVAVDPYPYSVMSEFVPETTEEYDRRMSSEAGAKLGRVVEVARQMAVPFDTCVKAAESPYEAIIEAARERGCDVIFMASHGRRGIRAVLLGSETQKVLTHSTVPVVVYR